MQRLRRNVRAAGAAFLTERQCRLKPCLVFQTTFLSVKTGYWGSIQPMLAQLKTMIVG